MAERRMLRQVMSPSDIYAHAESICDMLREQYGSYDADSLEEVLVDESFGQRLKARGYDLLGEGGESAEGTPLPLPPRRDSARSDVGASTSMRRPGGDRSVPVRRTGTNDGAVPMRRRDGSSDGGIPLRRGERSSNDGGIPRRRETGSQGDGVGQMRRRDGVPQSDGVPMRRRDVRPAGDMIPTPPAVEPTSNAAAPSPRRSWDTAREEAASARRENMPSVTPPTGGFGDARAAEPSQGTGVDGGREESTGLRTPNAERPTEPVFATPEQSEAVVQPVGPPVVEAPVELPRSFAANVGTEGPTAEAPVIEAPPAKPTPRTRRTTRSRTKADPDTAAE